MSRPLWIVSLPNEDLTSDQIFSRTREATSSRGHDYAEMYRFDIPDRLLVGTLDRLISLSDDLQRVDMLVENVVRKIERQFQELNMNNEELDIDGVPVERYLFNFSWDEAKYPSQRPLPELSNIIQGATQKVEEELKQLNTAYQEKKTALAAFGRKKGGSLMVASLDNILTPDVVPEGHFLDSEYLLTVVVVVPKAHEQTFLSTYMTLAGDVVSYGPREDREAQRGSPVVPGSAYKLLEEGDFALYTVTVLRGRYQPGYYDDDGVFEPGTSVSYVERFKNEAREHRFVVRDFKYDPHAQETAQARVAQLEVEVTRLWGGVLRWCKAHYGDAFMAWIHIKAIRTFVESVLRFGVPVNFTAIIYKPHNNKEKKLRESLAKLCVHLKGVSLMAGDDDTAAADFYPYVWSRMQISAS